MMKRKYLVAPLLLSIILSACNGKAKNDFIPKLDTDTKGSITIAGNYANFEALEIEFDEFQKYYPNIQLQYSFLSDGNGSNVYNATIETNLDSNTPADIYFTFDWMQTNDKYANLYDKFAVDLSNSELGIDYSIIDQQLIYHRDGAIPTLPVLGLTYGMLVNEKIFKENNLSIPKTYDELLSVSKSLINLGYQSPLMSSISDVSSFASALTYGTLANTARGNDKFIDDLNNVVEGAGENLRPILNQVKAVIDNDIIDVDYCAEFIDGYSAYSSNSRRMLMRFLEGNVPMLMLPADTASSAKKRESECEAFQNNPFSYTFNVVPFTNSGTYLYKVATISLSINKYSNNLDYAVEFMRFLISKTHLTSLANNKMLLNTVNDSGYVGLFSPLNNFDKNNIVYSSEAKLTDNTFKQFRNMVVEVAKGAPIDDVIIKYGTY